MEALQGNLKVSHRPNRGPEIFKSIQGEGTLMGTPSAFLRLAMCNLSCVWCDTKYTWDWDHYDYSKEVISLSLGAIFDQILALKCRHMVVTGGEPLLQQKALAPLIGALKARGLSFEVETNGTISPIPALLEDIDQWNVSPKLGSSGNPISIIRSSQPLQHFTRLDNAYFKFVIVDQADIDMVLAIITEYDIPRDRVLLMPEGTSVKILRERGTWISKTCADQGFRFTSRMHVLLWGNKRGR